MCARIKSSKKYRAKSYYKAIIVSQTLTLSKIFFRGAGRKVFNSHQSFAFWAVQMYISRRVQTNSWKIQVTVFRV